ncbi:MEDS domain-containing protein [Geopsychrobacter electrodiphilus]|uniref:MEDS domain-containing protein n=1 Tax=Geopsychrobacter electrodiphilus TaxID=225196 RepID=UPI0003700320|nr:MEDS domain-containing protein [Geopsychrobacter electrodiphilus]
MTQKTTKINLGFAEVEIPVGTHICQIYNDEDERNDALLHFLASGLKARERNACFSEQIDNEKLRQLLAEDGIDLDQARAKNDLITAVPSEVYFHQGRFEPERMLNLLATFHNDAKQEGYPAARVIGEMTSEIQKVPGGSRLFEYEAAVNQLLKKYPVTAVCQYDAHVFDGATIMDVMRVHPMMLVRGNVIHNPFYVPAQEILH